jgi:undecaprenyl-diphosphatase
MPASITELVRGMRDTRIATVPVVLMAIVAAGIYSFLAIAEEVREQEIERIDSALLLLFRDPSDLSTPIGPKWFSQAVVEITTLGGYPVLVTLVAVVAGFLIVSRYYGAAVFMLASIISGTIASHFLKLVYDRPRPDVVDHLVEIHTASFPSGHATMSAVVYLTLATLVVRLVDNMAVRIYVIAVAIFLTFAVGMSRIYLGVHWPSDVAAGWALGATWACLSWLTVSGLRRLRNRR